MKMKNLTTASKKGPLDFKPVENASKRVSGAVPKLPVLNRLIVDMSSEAYHGAMGTWSSSQLKTVLEDEDLFIAKYIKRSVAREEKDAFDLGTYFHTGVLEPHKIKSETAVFQGVRYGKKWEEFKKANPGKTVVNEKQLELANQMIEAVNASPVSMQYLQGKPEISLFIKLVIFKGKIFAPDFGKVLTSEGWEKTPLRPTKGYEIIMKVRADCLGADFISDLKSTSGHAKQEYSVRDSISKYRYDLSAALYLDMFSLVKPEVNKFIWIFASKSKLCAAPWIASERNIRIGRAKWSKAVMKIFHLEKANWEIVDYLRVAEPMPYEDEWLREQESDLL